MGTEGSGTTTQSPASEGSSGTPTNVNTQTPKHNPWADETVRNTASGPVEVKPAKPNVTPVIQPKPVAPVPPVTTPTTTAQTPPAQGQTPPVTPPTQQVPPVQSGQSFDPKALAREFAAELRNSQSNQGQSQQGQQQQLTDQQFNEMFGVVTATPELYTSIFGFAPEKPEQVVALNSMLEGINRSSLKMANYMFDQKLKAMEEKLSGQIRPVLQANTQEIEKKLETEFFQTYPGLTDHRPLLVEIRDLIEAQVKAGKITFNSPKELIDHVAERASKLLGKPVAELTKVVAAQGTGSTGQQQSTVQSRQMTTTSVGGRVGSATATGASKKPKSTAETLFGDE